MRVTLQMLEYFIALAEHRSFTDAASACFVSQPALSRAIASLEKELGCTIVERGKTVVLTPAGEVLLSEARRILLQIDGLGERVRAADRVRQTLLLGYTAYGMLNAFRQTNRELLGALPGEGIRLETVYDATPAIKQRLVSGELDGAILPENCVWNLPHCRTCVVSTLKSKLMIPREHPLFDRESVSMRELTDSKFVFFSREDMPMVFARHVGMCRDAGFSPEIVGYGRKAGDVIDLLHQYGAVSIASCAFDYAESEELRLVPIRENYTSSLVLAIRGQQVNPEMLRLFGRLERAAGERREGAAQMMT